MFKYVIGDVHGCLHQLLPLLAKIEKDAEGEKYQLIFVGDYIDRGPQSKEVIDLVMKLEAENGAIPLRGNHEQMMLQAHRNPQELYFWIMNGGAETNKSYADGGVSDKHIEWCTKLRWYHEDEHRIYVHAGVIPHMPFEEQLERYRNELIWIREPFTFSKWPNPKLVVHGHTPTKVIFHDWKETGRVNVDTGGVFYGTMTAAKFSDEEKFPLAILQVHGEVPARYR